MLICGNKNIKILKKRKKWLYRLFTSKMSIKFVYGFAVSIDWETHQLLTKTE